MSSFRVPTSLLSKNLRRLSQANNEPSGLQVVNGTIVNVLSTSDVSIELLEKLTKGYPGLVLGVVKADNGNLYSCFFEYNDEALYLLYGNAVLLVGRRCQIVYMGTDIYNGRIRIMSDPVMPILDTVKICEAFDIGSIV